MYYQWIKTKFYNSYEQKNKFAYHLIKKFKSKV